MSLIVKGNEAKRLAQEVAALTGESTSMAVTEALRERHERVRREQDVGLSSRLLAIGKDCATTLKSPFARCRTELYSMTRMVCRIEPYQEYKSLYPVPNIPDWGSLHARRVALVFSAAGSAQSRGLGRWFTSWNQPTVLSVGRQPRLRTIL
jgi:antitoxin VapB